MGSPWHGMMLVVKVAVVGAGFAGLSAAQALENLGHDVHVFEARERVGGRVWSQELIPGDGRTVIERGAEFVLEGYDRMSSIAADVGLTFADMGMSYYVREPRGVAATPAAVSECAEQVAKASASAPWGTSLAEVTEQVRGIVDAAALTAYLSRLAVTNAGSEDRLSAALAADMTSGFEQKPSFRVVGGNQRFAIEVAQRLSRPVTFNAPVTAIHWGQEGVRLRFAEGSSEVTADRLVLAVPLAVARELFFAPALPAWKLQAWQRAGFGHAAKLHIPLSAPTTFGAVQDVNHRFWTWTATDASGDVQPVLHCFSGSGAALDALRVESGPQEWAARAVELRPELSLNIEAALVTSWSDDPFAREAYSALTVEVHEGDDELLAQPVETVHFAGEHTAGDWAGLMEGAIRSGERAGAEVDAALTR